MDFISAINDTTEIKSNIVGEIISSFDNGCGGDVCKNYLSAKTKSPEPSNFYDVLYKKYLRELLNKLKKYIKIESWMYND